MSIESRLSLTVNGGASDSNDTVEAVVGAADGLIIAASTASTNDSDWVASDCHIEFQNMPSDFNKCYKPPTRPVRSPTTTPRTPRRPERSPLELTVEAFFHRLDYSVVIGNRIDLPIESTGSTGVIQSYIGLYHLCGAGRR